MPDALPPVRREVIVAADPARAFAVFTDEMSAWWPLAELSVLGAGSLVAFEDGKLVEGTMDGQRAVWGEVLAWEQDRLLRFTWHPGSAEAQATEVTVTFTATDGGTLVVLEHAGWEVLADPAGRRSEYEGGWPGVLALYEGYVSPEEAADPGETWVALMHTPAPSAPAGDAVFADPRFGQHVAFLQRMQEQGYLVAAGPLADTAGAGMTVLRLPGSDRLEDATALATIDDRAVADGLFTVEVRPWGVMFHSLA